MFHTILEDHDLSQHMKGATHVRDHTLGLIITRNNKHILNSLPTIKDPVFCDNNGNAGGDHSAVTVHLQMTKPSKGRKNITFRNFR